MTAYTKTEVIDGQQATLTIWDDTDCDGPRGTAVSTFWAKDMHRRYNFHESAADDVLSRLRGQVPEKYQHDDVACVAWLTAQQTERSDYAAIPVTMYDHGGLSFSEGTRGDQWDSGQIGWLIVDAPRWAKEHGGEWSQAGALAHLRSDLRELDDYYQLGIYGFALTVRAICECCGQQNLKADPIMQDECGGFYGSEVQETIRGELPEKYKHLIDDWD